MFASFVAPFGGFFASGFKRAFKIKVRIYFCCVPSETAQSDSVALFLNDEGACRSLLSVMSSIAGLW